MFSAQTYRDRRDQLRGALGSGLVLLPGNVDVPRNYAGNPFPFRQDSCFLYFMGMDLPGLAGLIDLDEPSDTLFGTDFTLADEIWAGPQASLAEQARAFCIDHFSPMSQLPELLQAAMKAKRPIHLLPPCSAEVLLQLCGWFSLTPDQVTARVSTPLIKAVVAQRIIKTDAEIDEIEAALKISFEMNTHAMRASRPGRFEYEVSGAVEGLVAAKNSELSFPTIFSVRGEVLHGHSHHRQMRDGDLLVLDSGAESPMHYASDITRTFPVSPEFSSFQRDIYQIVLQSQLRAIEMMKPSVRFKDVHLEAATVIADGLKQLGFMKGSTEDAVVNGAHALFFPHGLGHAMGLDVHDMEGLGEDHVGYDAEVQRSDQFGLAYLRFGRRLQPGMVMTVEPGLYFMPELIAQWRSEKRFSEFIDYDRVTRAVGFGGVRIEDDVLVTEDGARVLGPPIPKTVEEIEAEKTQALG